MHRRPTLTQRDGLFSTTRFILYGNRVRVIRQSPLMRDDQYIPIAAVDPDARIVRAPDLRLASMALLLFVPGLLALLKWPTPPGAATAAASLGLALLGALMLATRAWPGRTYVQHGALQLVADQPDPKAFRAFEAHLITATREQLLRDHADGAPESGEDGPDGRVSLAREIRRLHEHCAQGHLTREVFVRQKQRLLQRIREYVR